MPPVRNGFVAVREFTDGSWLAVSGPGTEMALHWAVQDGVLHLGPSLRSVAQILRQPPPLNIQKLADYVALYDDPSTTELIGVHRVPAGHALRWRTGESPSVFRWLPTEATPDSSIAEAQGVAMMREAVRGAVEAAIPADGLVAATLSGGLDSSAVVGFAARVAADRMTAYTHVPLPGTADPSDRWEADDGPYAQRFARELGLAWESVVYDGSTDPLTASVEMARRSWHPAFNPTGAVWLLEIVRRAEALGAQTMLTGTTGNGAFSRNRLGLLHSLATRGHLGILVRHAQQRRSDGEARAYLRTFKEALPFGAATVVDRVRGRGGESSDDVLAMLPIRRDVVSEEARSSLRAMASEEPGTHADWVAFATLDVARFDGLQAMTSLRWCDPLSDHQVVSTALRLPDAVWLAGGRDRGLAREVVRGVVPDYIRLRSTLGAQAADVAAWMVGREGAYRDMIDRFRASPSVGEFLDIDRLEAAIGPAMSDPATASIWDETYGRGFAFGAYAVWYEDEVLLPARSEGRDQRLDGVRDGVE